MIDFTNTEVAFSMKTNNDLRQSQLLFSTLSSPKTVNFLKGLTMASLNLRLPIKGIIRATVFRQFCGGESIEACGPQIQRLAEGKVMAILDYSVEGKASEADFDRTMRATIETIEYSKGHADVPLSVFKPTGLGSIEIYEKISTGKELSADEQSAWERTQDRWKTIFEAGWQHGVPVMVDAEESWIQPALDDLCLSFMRKYNKEKPMVYNTAQMYRHDRIGHLQRMLELAKAEGFIYAVKIVRGAYMEKERERAVKLGYVDPINPTKAATDRDYNAASDLILNNINHMAVVIGTHNEESVERAAKLMSTLGIPLDSNRVYVAQLFGMSDHISFNAAVAGMNVAKYLPFGPVNDVMPYLFRRAEENTSVEGQTGRELGLIQKELVRRKGL
ncbi:MAG: hypothetical protein RL754_1334 [Bacteroidota bacterium]